MIVKFDPNAIKPLSIISATYGADGQQSDVTAAVTSQINNGVLHLNANNNTLRSDPAVGKVKTLVIKYRSVTGEKQEKSVLENEDIELQLFHIGHR